VPARRVAQAKAWAYVRLASTHEAR
jgi:hypothetical protein